MRTLMFKHLSTIEHSNVLCETDFSPLALLLSPLRRSMKMKTVERKMWLMLNKDLWHPLPDRAEERVVKELMEKVKLSKEELRDGWETASDSEDDCFVD